jgi:hypothetical protein
MHYGGVREWKDVFETPFALVVMVWPGDLLSLPARRVGSVRSEPGEVNGTKKLEEGDIYWNFGACCVENVPGPSSPALELD